MDINQYQKEANATKSDMFACPVFSQYRYQNNDQVTDANIDVDVLHAVVGISTEAGELLDVAKKAMFYGKPVDYVNLDEEMGDVLWYIAIYANQRGTTIEKLAEVNNAKLKARFPNKFTAFHANNRDLFIERGILENGSK